MYVIKGIIFDCFGVLCRGALDYFVSRAMGDVRRQVLDTNRAVDYGYISHQEFAVRMAELLGMEVQEIEHILAQRNVRDDEVVAYARSLAGRYKLGLLSNVGEDTIERLFTPAELHRLFDTTVLSYQVGMIKPHTEIFLLTAERLGLRPDECVMIDDLPHNIEGAAMAGMHGIVYSSVPELREELARIEAMVHA